MRLSARILKNVIDVNHWRHSAQAYLAEGQENEVYIQLVDLDQSTKSTDEQSAAFPQYPIRYLSQATVIEATATFLNIDDSQEYEIAGTQPFADDKSIWKFVLSESQIPASGNLQIKITEDGKTKTLVIRQAIVVDLINQGSC